MSQDIELQQKNTVNVFSKYNLLHAAKEVCKLTMEKAEMVVKHSGRGSSNGGGQVLQTVKGRCQANCIQLVRVHQ